MWKALHSHANKHALAYTIGLFLGLQGFFTGYYDNFWPLEKADMARLGWWQVLAALGKSLSFALGIVAGYLIKSVNGHETKTDAPAPPKP